VVNCQDEIREPDGLATPRMTTLALVPMAVNYCRDPRQWRDNDAVQEVMQSLLHQTA
jgi:hypothetical protein